MREEFLTVRRTARYYTLGPHSAGELWIACHGYAQLARFFLRAFEPLDDGNRHIVAPEALNRYYYETAPGVHASDARVSATWMTREDRAHEIADYVAYLDRLHDHLTRDTPRERIVAFGFSQGGATASRWAALGRTRIDHVVLWASGLAHDLQLTTRLLRGAALTIAAGDADPAMTPVALTQEETRLRAAGIAHSTFRYEGAHRMEAQALRTLAASLA